MVQKKQAAQKKPTTNRKPSKVVIDRPLEKFARSDLDAIAKKAGVKPDAYKTKALLVIALKEHTRVKAKAKPKGGRASKIDWNKAFEWYIEDHTRSYSDVAKAFGVSTQSVERNATYTYTDGEKKGSWVTWAERRHELGEIARKKAEEDYKKTAPARSQQHLLQYRNLQIAASNKVAMLAHQGQWLIDPDTGKRIKVQEFDARQLADVAKALKLAIDGERVIMGLPTSVSTIKPGADDETGKGWGELLALAMKQANEQS